MGDRLGIPGAVDSPLFFPRTFRPVVILTQFRTWHDTCEEYVSGLFVVLTCDDMDEPLLVYISTVYSELALALAPAS